MIKIDHSDQSDRQLIPALHSCWTAIIRDRFIRHEQLCKVLQSHSRLLRNPRKFHLYPFSVFICDTIFLDARKASRRMCDEYISSANWICLCRFHAGFRLNVFVQHKDHNIGVGVGGGGGVLVRRWHCHCAEELCETDAKSVIGEKVRTSTDLPSSGSSATLPNASTTVQCPARSWIYINTCASTAACSRSVQNNPHFSRHGTARHGISTTAQHSDCKIIPFLAR